MNQFLWQLSWLLVVLLIVSEAHAQVPGGVGDRQLCDKQERISETHYRCSGNVEIRSQDTVIYADYAEVFSDEDRALVTGNVVFTQGRNRIAADRAEFNIKTRLGTFYNATGIAAPQPQRAPMGPGAMLLPTATGQDTDVYFFGETIEKIGPKKYKITNGGFTTCVQPTPRWDFHADTVILNVDHYTLLRQAVLTVKGVPLLYVPVLYYPTKREERATGFLIPSYGSSTLRGQQIHNAFFWAIDRSQDATFMHEWYSKIGQGGAGEYRYNFGGGSDGDFSMHFLDQHEVTYGQLGETPNTLPASRSYELRGYANQMLPGGFRARTNIGYFSSITTNQTFYTNVNDASRNQRTVGGNVVGVWGGSSLNGTFDRTEYFYDAKNSGVTGGTPRIAFTRSERPLWGSDLYYSVAGEYAHLLQERKAPEPGKLDVIVSEDRGLTRVDFNPQIRYPFKKWQWFTVNSSLTWRDTYYTRSFDPTQPGSNVVIDRGLNRHFFTASTQMIGPVFNRIWDTPGNGYAEKFKHSIEPFFTAQRTSAIDNVDRIVALDSIDYIIGRATQYSYGLNNRFYAKMRQEGGRPGMPREIIGVELAQTYYTDDRAAQFDRQYSTSSTTAAPSHFSPLALSVRVLPTNDLNMTMRAEFDSRYHSLRTINVNASYSWASHLQTTVIWSKRGFIKELSGFDNRSFLDHYLNIVTTARTRDNRFGSTYGFNFDVLNTRMLQQRLSGFYNAQCCGIGFEYQTYNFNYGNFAGGFGSFQVPADHRFSMSFTLAGLGNFSPFNGALGGMPR